MTRQQIGRALGYAEPRKAIESIHSKHEERLNKFSVVTKLRTTDRKVYEVFLYSAKGVYEICRWSRQPKANEFYDKVYEILEGLRTGYLKLEVVKQSKQWQQTRLEAKNNRLRETEEIKRFIKYAKEHGSQHADTYYITFSKLANKAVGISSNQREKATINQLNNLILIENIINRVIQIGIEEKLNYKSIYQACRERIEQFREIAYLNVEIKGIK